jgi:RsiW-degrading membrane proteinase PrsW (M82 family)
MLGNTGYVAQIFQAEMLNRLGDVIFFLPMAIVVIVIGWRYRAKTKPRYLFYPFFAILPVVFNGFVFLYRAILNVAFIWLVLSMNFSTAIVVFVAAMAVSLFLSMILLAAQHS